jgi:ribulose-5-phosphate 4-epimerase/fuculose-1-phosphate aldolase
MVLYLCVLIVFSPHRELLKLILAMNPSSRWFCHTEKWVKKLPSVLWALHTTPSWATGHTSFSLVYGSEVMLPTEVEHKSFCVQHFNKEQSDDSRVDDLTKLEEPREATVI